MAQRDGIDYNLAYIPLDFHPKRTSEFDTNYMKQEFDLAFNLARPGYKWAKYPPGYEPHIDLEEKPEKKPAFLILNEETWQPHFL